MRRRTVVALVAVVVVGAAVWWLIARGSGGSSPGSVPVGDRRACERLSDALTALERVRDRAASRSSRGGTRITAEEGRLIGNVADDVDAARQEAGHADC